VTRVLSADWVLPVSGPAIADGAVAIGEDGRIAAVGAAAELGHGERFEGCAIVPGFVNAHSHLEYAMYAGFGDGLSFAPWIALHVQRKGKLSLEEMTDIARVGAADCLRSGVTTVGDASFAGAAATACAELGLRAIVYLEVFGGPEAIETMFTPARDRVAEAFSDRVQLGISPHAPYTVRPELYAACLELGLPIATHLSESADEAAYVHDGSGPWSGLADLLVPPLGSSGIRALAERGLLGSRVVAAHCVTVDEDEIAILAQHGVSVAHCPRSNAMLGCGAAPLRALREAGVAVGIATDSPASTPPFDLFDEMRAAVYTSRLRERDTKALSPPDALELATLGGARALGLEADVGSLDPGKAADLAIVRLDEGGMWPVEDPAAAVVLGGSPGAVVGTLVGGIERYRKGSTEWRGLRRRAQTARSRMLA
jgi:cytosine/adenosine deaminase-related metal-dependent hydrolase